MARTSRNPAVAANSMDALDNIDLDDMFADDGDALFDGLDLDLGNMDDITGAASVNDHVSNARVAPLHEQQTPTDETSRVRRPNKRKIKSPVFFDDDDEDYNEIQKKKTKKRPPKAAGPSKKTSKSKAAPPFMPPILPAITTIPAPTPLKSKKAKTAPMNMPPNVQRGVVAAAGQFGGRNKRGGASSFSYTLPKAAGALKAKPLPPPPAMRASSLEGTMKLQQETRAPMGSLTQVLATHPVLQQGNFCGLLPSNTLFYPFMPTLPNEPSLKHRKLFPVVDRIHTTFMTSVLGTGEKSAGSATPSVESDPLVALMQECYKEDKPAADGAGTVQDSQQLERAVAIAVAAEETRRIVSVVEKHKLAGDLMAVCSLLKRQHDFLKQNNSNMEQWCKSHFTEQDYASVFLPPKQKPKRKAAEMSGPGSVLSSFASNEIKVRVLCSAIQETSLEPLYATLRLAPKTKEKDGVAPRSKKSKQSATASMKTSTASPTKSSAKSTPSYVEMKPSRRRKTILEIIGRSAREIEMKYLQRSGEQRQLLGRQGEELQKVIDNDKMQMIHTGGMWLWLEKSGHFARATEAECQWRLEGLVAPTIPTGESTNVSYMDAELTSRSQSLHAGSYLDRLQSLLVYGPEEEDDESSDDDSLEDLLDSISGTIPAMNVSQLTQQERSFLCLRSFGLLENGIKPPEQPSEPNECNGNDYPHGVTQSNSLQNRLDHSTGRSVVKERSEEINRVIGDMVVDLKLVDNLNSNRARFLESMAHMLNCSESDTKAKSTETSLISRCHQLVKKNREKGKTEGKPRPKTNEYALPW